MNHGDMVCVVDAANKAQYRRAKIVSCYADPLEEKVLVNFVDAWMSGMPSTGFVHPSDIVPIERALIGDVIFTNDLQDLDDPEADDVEEETEDFDDDEEDA